MWLSTRCQPPHHVGLSSMIKHIWNWLIVFSFCIFRISLPSRNTFGATSGFLYFLIVPSALSGALCNTRWALRLQSICELIHPSVYPSIHHPIHAVSNPPIAHPIHTLSNQAAPVFRALDINRNLELFVKPTCPLRIQLHHQRVIRRDESHLNTNTVDSIDIFGRDYQSSVFGGDALRVGVSKGSYTCTHILLLCDTLQGRSRWVYSNLNVFSLWAVYCLALDPVSFQAGLKLMKETFTSPRGQCFPQKNVFEIFMLKETVNTHCRKFSVFVALLYIIMS